jgi:sugar phosphate isomerase/epimerase
MTGDPRFSISQISTLPASFEDDLRVYRDAGAEGIGIWEIKLPEDDGAAREAFEASGLVSTNAVPAVPSIGPLELLPGPSDPKERVEAYRAGLRRLAPFRPSAVVLLTGPGDRKTIVDGLRAIADEAGSLGLTVGVEPYEEESGRGWTIVSTIRAAVDLIEEADVAESVGVLFDLWHLWNAESLADDLAELGDRIVGVHVCDVRADTRSFADRVLPGEGVADVPRILGLLDRAGWDAFYDLEIFSDNGAFGNAFPDSLWNWPPEELARRGREAFLDCWRRRSP